ncbi:MAG: MgtC/SapB family protein, partial [Bacteroidales bacterium]|nr:MgtC/SapB family protein [Bacteroidales bacterium]
MELMYELRILLHVVIASLLGGVIGYEREKTNKPAGIKTNMIVGGSVALLVSLGEAITVHFQELGLSEVMQTDPTRIIQAIIVGVSFIGAGTVMQLQKVYKVKYLTTAASILYSTGVGISVALGQYVLAVGLTVFILIIYYPIKWIEGKFIKSPEDHED